MATKSELRQEIDALRHVGVQMSNLCFNWSQHAERFTDQERQMMQQLARQWDAIKRMDAVKLESFNAR